MMKSQQFERGGQPISVTSAGREADHTFDSPLRVSRLGSFLWSDVQRLSVGCLEPTYFQRSTRTEVDFLIARWNLIVSPALGGCWPR